MLIPPSPIIKDDFIHQEWLRQVRDFLTVTKLATLDFPNTAANGTANLTVSMPGVKPGDSVMVTPSDTFSADWTWCGYVSANDTVTVRVHNNTGGADDPASSVWRITVFKY